MRLSYYRMGIGVNMAVEPTWQHNRVGDIISHGTMRKIEAWGAKYSKPILVVAVLVMFVWFGLAVGW